MGHTHSTNEKKKKLRFGKAKATALTSTLQSLECMSWLPVEPLPCQAQEYVFIHQGAPLGLTGALADQGCTSAFSITDCGSAIVQI